MEMKHSPVSVTATSPLHMPSHTISSPHASSSCSSGMSPVTFIDETTSDVPMPGSGLMTHSFVPKMEDTCTDSGMYSMDATMLNDRMSLLSRRPVLPNKPSPTLMAVAEGMSSAVQENSVAGTENKFLPNSFETLSKNVAPNMPWLPPPPETEGTEANIDNWLGQIFKYDNLIPGLSLPQKLPQ